jgi:biopolymer transport protein ExbD/biopolymer transport protein TolR
MGMQAGGDSEYNSEINVTPMVDIMLVLLIIFMVVTPLLQQGVTVQLPKDMEKPIEDPEITKDTSVVISIPNNSEVYIGKDLYARDLLGEKIGRMMEGKTGDKRIVYVKSGINVDYGTLVDTINVIRSNNIDKIGLVAEKKKGSSQQQ